MKKFFKKLEISLMLMFGIIKLGFRIGIYTFKFMWGLQNSKNLPVNDQENGKIK